MYGSDPPTPTRGAPGARLGVNRAMRSVLTKILGDPNDKALKHIGPIVEDINALEPAMQELSNEELRELAPEFRGRLEEGESLDDLLPEAFAATREAARRVLGQRHFDVQMMGGVVLHQGKIAEMRTGEGKTLTATSPMVLNALTRRGAHLVTVNDYLVRRDTQRMGQIYDALGLTIGCIQHEVAYVFDAGWESPEDERLKFLRPVPKAEAYAADITYGTNNEFGFDYLRDNMVVSAEQRVQRPLYYGIVDEVDNILIDEARTPLIISGQAGQVTDRYDQFAGIVKQLRVERHYEIDLKHKTVSLTEDGIDRVEELAGIPAGEGIYDERHIELTHYLEQALKANYVFHRDKDYVVNTDGEIVIVDEFTGRMMPGRRWSDGLHQAVEAKEGVHVRRQNVTMATITFQNYFRMYEKLAGMTGTAKTEAEEFIRIYNLDVVTIPTNRPMIRADGGDLIFTNEEGKYRAVVTEIEEMRNGGRPVLVGTASIEASERLSELLKRRAIEHDVLNAKQHEREAAIISRAGEAGTVTIATNMAGRGTDIQLGPGVVEAGGLHIVGTERHDARRIDNQLRGRAGRQGDPGSSRFFVSLEDDLMRRFGSERISGLMGKLGMDDDTPIEHGLISKSIESAQTKVEGNNFDTRKHVVQYDDVMNRHREVIYADRGDIVSGEDVQDKVMGFIASEVEKLVLVQFPEKGAGPPDLDVLLGGYLALVPSSKVEEPDLDGRSSEDLIAFLEEDAGTNYADVEARFGPETMRTVERRVMLSVIDKLWVEHLTSMDQLREGVGLQQYGQKDPLVVYKTEGYRMFQSLLDHIQHDVVYNIYRVQPVITQQPVRTRMTEETTTNRSDEPVATQRRSKTLGRNEPCWCGSGKKYKMCHGAPVSKAAV